MDGAQLRRRALQSRSTIGPLIVSGFGTRDSGLGARDSGLGARDSGLGTRDSGLATRDSGLESRIPDPGSSRVARFRWQKRRRVRRSRLQSLRTWRCCPQNLLAFWKGPSLAANARMEEDDMFLQTLAPRNIVGVHNYCDGWCERCGFADRCVVNASRPREESLPRTEDPLLDHLKERFDQVRTLVTRRSTFSVDELMKNVEIREPDPIEEAKEEARRNRLRAHPVIREAHAYSELAHAWFEAETEGMRAHADALVRRAEVEDVEDLPLMSELARILDSIEIVRWDSYLIFVKLHRAIEGREEDAREAMWDDPIQNDHHGSAKLALICIDRSEGAWRAIDRWFPSCGGATLLADQLATLRAAVEREFPRARAFLRPGFDGLVTPD